MRIAYPTALFRWRGLPLDLAALRAAVLAFAIFGFGLPAPVLAWAALSSDLPAAIASLTTISA